MPIPHILPEKSFTNHVAAVRSFVMSFFLRPLFFYWEEKSRWRKLRFNFWKMCQASINFETPSSLLCCNVLQIFLSRNHKLRKKFNFALFSLRMVYETQNVVFFAISQSRITWNKVPVNKKGIYWLIALLPFHFSWKSLIFWSVALHTFLMITDCS